MLPARVQIARVQVPAGVHEVRVDLRGRSFGSLSRQVEVPPGGFAVVDFTTLR